VICSDVSKRLFDLDELDSIIAIMEQTFNFNYWASVEEQRAMCDIVISPDVDGYRTFAFRELDEILEEGKRAVQERKEELRQMADTLRRPGEPQFAWMPADIDTVRISRAEVAGLEDVPESVVRGQMNLPESGAASARQIEEEIDRIFSTRFFERVTYALEQDTAGRSILHIQVSERTEDELRIGFRYDLRDQGRLLLNSTFRNVARRGSKLSVEAEVGNTLSLTTNYVLKIGKRKRVGGFARAQVLKSRFDEYVDAEPVSQISFRAARTEAGIGSIFSTQAHLGLSVLAEYSHTAPRITELPDQSSHTVFTLMPVATLWIDSFDRTAFPTRGIFLYAQSLLADTRFGSDISMGQHRVIGLKAIRLHPRAVLQQEIEFAFTRGDRQEIPGPWRLGLGGENKGLFETGRFVGLDLNERTGRYLTKLGARLRFEVQRGRYLNVVANVGTASDRWGWDALRDELISGFGLGIALDTVVGPVDVMFSAGNTNDLSVSLNVGYRFATTY
jgi:outer membrane protein assembly factor BamA